MPEIAEDVLARITQAYIESANDRLDRIDQSIDDIFHEKGNRGELYYDLQKEIHSLKGSAGSYGFHLITTIAHRLEDYMESSWRLGKNQWLDVQKYIDEIRRIFDQGHDPVDTIHQQILQRLPSRSGNIRRRPDAKLFTALLVMDSGVQRKFVGTELVSSGIDVSFAGSPLVALDLVFKLKPDVVFCSQEFPDISGADLSKMLSVIDAGRTLPFAILTGNENLSAADLGLPEQVGIIQKDSKVFENIMGFLSAAGIFER